MSHLNYVLDKIIDNLGYNPFPNNLESYLENYIPNTDFIFDTFQQTFKLPYSDLEKIYKEGYEAYLNHDYENSTLMFRWLVFFNPFVSKFWFSLGASLHMNQAYEQALHAYAATAVLRQYDPYPHYYAYICYDLLENEQDAIKALDIAWEKAKNNSLYSELKEEILEIKNSLL